MIAKIRAGQELPKNTAIFDAVIRKFVDLLCVEKDKIQDYMNFIHEKINFSKSNPTHGRWKRGFLRLLPLFFQVALFDLILPP